MSAKRIILVGYGKTSDHQSGKVLAYVLGRRKDKVFLDLKAMTNHLGLHDSTPMVGEHMSVT